MNLNVSTAVSIQEGVGEIRFPPALKTDLLKATIYCQSLYFTSKGGLHAFFVVCDGSYHITQNGEVKKNVLAMFQNKPGTNVIQFSDHKLPITSPQERLKVEIVDYDGVRQKMSGYATIGISGQVANKLLAI